MVHSVGEQKMSVFSARYRWQIIATMTVHIMTLTHGIGVGWLAPSLPLLGAELSPLDRPISIEEASWVGSLIGLGALAGNIIFGLLVDRLGRKMSMYFLAIPNMTYWILIYTAQDVTYLYAGRFLAGISGGGCYVVLPIFVAEISDNNIRGALSSMAMMYVSIGMIIGYILTTYLSYYLMPCIAILLPVVYLLAIWGLSETPQHLLRKGRNEQAEKSYYFYKNLPASNPDNESAHNDAAKKEFETFKQQVLKGGVQQDVGWKDFFNLPTMKIFALNFTLLVCNQLSGSFAFFNYTSHIFNELETQMAANTCTIIVGGVQVLGIICAVILVDRVGRRKLLLTSLAGMGLGELGIGLLKEFASKEFLSGTNWLSLLLMCWVAYIASLGVIPLIFVIIIEQLPAKIRSLGTSICMATLSTFIFVSLKIYPMMIFGPGLPATMYMSAGVCAIGFIILGLFLPETKGKQLTH
ncbi:facilitated trehalose transporter Tret1-like [Drosophila novamexicana]|uniref:facilitated trehalose transporter Tret1-like n=1 Tax=Drosophila novamexicana TaxID=47314 RepID=UPI0011E604CA|nr:facilitated trehalose transporter Tret1-like [Drosophila novamexicana]